MIKTPCSMQSGSTRSRNMHSGRFQKDKRFQKGDQVYVSTVKKFGTIVCLRNEAIEREYRRVDPTHYYYSIIFADKTSDNYVHQKDMVKALAKKSAKKKC